MSYYLKLVFESLVWSQSLPLKALDWDQDQSIYFQIVKKTGLNQYGLVLSSFLWC